MTPCRLGGRDRAQPAADHGPIPSVHELPAQGYSICFAVFPATSPPRSLPTTCRLMSMPAAIPAEQITRPLSTKRRSA